MPKNGRVGSTLGYDRASGKGEGQVGIIRKERRKEGFSSSLEGERIYAIGGCSLSSCTVLRVNYRNLWRRRCLLKRKDRKMLVR